MTASIPALLPDILFYVFSGMALAGAFLVVLKKNPMTCAVSLVVTVLSIAMLYFLLSAHFVAVAQMIIYAGAIVVLFIFVIMLLNLTEEEIGRFRFSLFKLVGVFVVLGTVFLIVPGIRSSVPPAPNDGSLEGYGTTREVGRLLFSEYVLPFELTGVLILSAMLAGVVLAKRDLAPKKTYSLLDWFLGLLK